MREAIKGSNLPMNHPRSKFDLKAAMAEAVAAAANDQVLTIPRTMSASIESQRAVRDASYIRKHGAIIEHARVRTEEILKYLSDELGHVPDPASVAVRCETMREWDMQKICSQLLTSESVQWKVQPRRFSALALEYESRVATAGMVLSTCFS